MTIFFVILLLIVLVIIFIIFIQSKEENINQKNNHNFTIKNDQISLDNLALPRKIEKLDYSSLFQACRVVFDSFKALNYTNKEISNLDKLEWHSWQISLLLAFMKVYNSTFIPYNKNLFHNAILELKDKDIDFEIERIIKKYSNHVNIDKPRDDLSKDLVWTARDVSIIFYTIMINKKY